MWSRIEHALDLAYSMLRGDGLQAFLCAVQLKSIELAFPSSGCNRHVGRKSTVCCREQCMILQVAPTTVS
jgi:hypothetical protein